MTAAAPPASCARGGEAAAAALDDSDETEGRGELADPLAEPTALPLRKLEDWQLEHEMGEPDSEHRAGELRRDVRRRVARPHLAGDGGRHRHRWIEVRARDRRQGKDERQQRAAGRQRVGEERQGQISAGEALRHDAGADDGGEQQGAADAFRNGAAADAGVHAGSGDRPISWARRCRASRSSLSIGNATKSLMRASRRR